MPRSERTKRAFKKLSRTARAMADSISDPAELIDVIAPKGTSKESIRLQKIKARAAEAKYKADNAKPMSQLLTEGYSTSKAKKMVDEFRARKGKATDLRVMQGQNAARRAATKRRATREARDERDRKDRERRRKALKRAQNLGTFDPLEG